MCFETALQVVHLRSTPIASQMTKIQLQEVEREREFFVHG